ncbi:MAG: mercuric transporter MerT family protein [Bacteriovoracia bacterium]
MNKNHAQKASLAGSLLTAFLASVCCIGPVVFAIMGISGAAFIQKFEAYRPLFIVVASVFLGTAFYFTYRKKPAQECAEGTFCANPKSDRINKIVLWVATVLVALFIFFPSIISFAGEAKPQANTIERDYFVKGMTCGGCVFGVKHALKKAGIADLQIVEVDYKTPDPKNKIGHAKIRFSKDQYLGQEIDCKIVREIRQSPGYVAYWSKDNTDPCKLN